MVVIVRLMEIILVEIQSLVVLGIKFMQDINSTNYTVSLSPAVTFIAIIFVLDIEPINRQIKDLFKMIVKNSVQYDFNIHLWANIYFLFRDIFFIIVKLKLELFRFFKLKDLSLVHVYLILSGVKN